ncbi:hypothetical protein QQ045_002866 [Rhodiola kirilowii]
MYSRNTSVRERELSMDRKGPSFSSTLLDEIYRSIDDGTAREDRRTERTRLVENWIEKKKLAEIRTKRNCSSPVKMELDKKLHYVENDPLFFSSGSNSSDTNSSLFSDHEPIPTTTNTRSSCFLPPKPKPIRTSVKSEKPTGDKKEHDEVPASAKSRALKLYAHLKKMKQPISPGVKLTAFINSIMSNSKKAASKSSTTPKPTCSSASSLRRSCLNQQTTSSNRSNSVRFNVVIEAEAKPVQSRTLTRVDQEKPKQHQIHPIEKNRALSKTSLKTEFLKPIAASKRVAEDEDCGASDCSEDLFEIDHRKLSNGNGRYSDELPVYETTTSNHSRVGIK